MFAGKQLEDVYYPTGEIALLNDYNIQNLSTITLLCRLPRELQLKTEQKEKKVEIKHDGTESDLKALLRVSREFPAFSILSYSGFEMKESDKLSKYSLKNGDVVDLNKSALLHDLGANTCPECQKFI